MENGQIYAAISAAMADISAIGKDKYNQQQGFKFRGIDDVMNALKPILTKNKIFTVPQVLEQTREIKVTAKGGELRYSLLKIAFRFYATDGSFVEAVTLGEGMDSGDKASNKAMAIAYKYALFQVFCIPTEEMNDPDGESYETKHETETQKKPEQPQQQSKPVENQTETPADYIKRECRNIGMDVQELSRVRAALVEENIVRNIPTKEMTMADAKAMMDAVKANFREAS
jgi:hypothetical protein|nr:MAG TPA: ERF superfamily protein [Caudoviricetes sp.]